MKIKIENIKENDDGSADCNVYMDEEAKDHLIRYAITACLTDAIKAGKLAIPTGEE